MALSNRLFVHLVNISFILCLSTVFANPLKSSARVSIIQDRSVADGYKVEIESNGEKRELQLTSLENIWSDDAQAVHIERNEKGEKVIERRPILNDLKIYNDQKRGAFLTIKDGKINGILDSNYMIMSEGENHFIQRSTMNKKNFNEIDYIVVNELSENMQNARPSSKNYDHSFNSRAINTYTPEVAVFVDSKLSNLLGSNTKIFEYLTIFWNAVNARFQTIDSPKINIRLVGCIIVRKSEDEPFLTNNKNDEGKIDGNKALYAGGKWIYENSATVPPHDYMYIQTGAGLIDIAGLAFLGTICLTNTGSASYSVGIGEDMKGAYDGVQTAAHELGHNLGAPHDPKTDDDTNECDWAKGYMMSYIPAKVKKFYFSPCSIESMIKKLASSQASCTTKNLSQTKPSGVFTSDKLPGQVLTMDEQCKIITDNDKATIYKKYDSENELCYDLKCTAEVPNGYIIVYTYRGALDESMCPSGKHCKNGVCA
ncbi:UNVERIFIED_CONTAM: hypothetical protein RMT77_019301 [Armadillidium vulgare]